MKFRGLKSQVYESYGVKSAIKKKINNEDLKTNYEDLII
jgi:hypothetical protein